MSRIIAAVAISLIAGFAAAVWLLGEGSTRDTPSSPSPAAQQSDSSMSIEERLQRMEQIMAEERDARMVLEDQLRTMNEEIERIDSAGPRVYTERTVSPEASNDDRRERAAAKTGQAFASAMQRFQEQRVSMLIEGGFSDDEARQIMRQESEAQYLAVQQAHDAQRRGETTDPLSAMHDAQSALRNQLGESDYERYLAAQGQPTAVQVLQVLDSSPGSRAGLQPGDQIVSYNGERVFGVNELRALTLQGTAGEDVVIEIDRDGVRMQLNLPRGPVGITGPGVSARTMNWWGGS